MCGWGRWILILKASLKVRLDKTNCVVCIHIRMSLLWCLVRTRYRSSIFSTLSLGCFMSETFSFCSPHPTPHNFCPGPSPALSFFISFHLGALMSRDLLKCYNCSLYLLLTYLHAMLFCGGIEY